MILGEEKRIEILGEIAHTIALELQKGLHRENEVTVDVTEYQIIFKIIPPPSTEEHQSPYQQIETVLKNVFKDIVLPWGSVYLRKNHGIVRGHIFTNTTLQLDILWEIFI